MAGKHRAKNRAMAHETSTWLGAGAITLGLGATMVSGAALAHAETSDSSGSTTSTNNSSGSPSSSTESTGSPSGSTESTAAGSTDSAGSQTRGNRHKSIHPSETRNVADVDGAVTPRRSSITPVSAKTNSGSTESTADNGQTAHPSVQPAVTAASTAVKPAAKVLSAAPVTPPVTSSTIVAVTPLITPPGQKTWGTPLEPVVHLLAGLFLSVGGMNPKDPMPNPASPVQGLLYSVAYALDNTLAPAPPAGTPTIISTDADTGTVTGSLGFATDRYTTLTYTGPTSSTGGGSVIINPDGTYSYTPTVLQRQTAADDTTDTFTATVHDYLSSHSVTVTVPVSSSTTTIQVGSEPFGMALSSDGSRLYVANIGDGTVSVINTATGTVTHTISVGQQPVWIALGPGGTAYVTNAQSNTVSVINTANNTVTDTISVGQDPFGATVNAAGTKLYVAVNDINTLTVINTANNTITDNIPVGPGGTESVVISPDGTQAYISDGGFNQVTVVNTATNTVTTHISTHNPAGMAFNPSTGNLYVVNGDGTVSVVNPATNTVTTTFAVGHEPQFLAFSPDGSTLYVANQLDGTISVIDTDTNTTTKTIPVGEFPQVVVVSPDGTKLYVANEFSDTVSVVALT